MLIITWDDAKRFRQSKLNECDCTQLTDAKLTEVEKAAWAKYRQDLVNITQDQTVDPTTITWPVPPNMIEDILERVAIPNPAEQIRATYAKQMAALAQPYTQTERETWFSQLKEADEWLADNTVATPMLSAIATARGITLDVLVAKVKENDALFRGAIGTLLGMQQAELDAIS